MAKILVIDDDPLIVDLLHMRLEEAGHQVKSASDSYGASAVAADFKPDLITLDFNLPAGDGVKTLARLRGSTFTAATPVIFITGISQYDLEPLLPPDPKMRFLLKPIDVDRLLKLIAELLGLPAVQPAAKPKVPPKIAPEVPPGVPPKALDAAPKDSPVDEGGSFGGDILDLDL